jgi:hypothetical protein
MIWKISFSLLLWAATLPASILSIQPVLLTASEGDSVNLNVEISNVLDLYAFQFDILFNPMVLSATSVVEGSFLPTGGTTQYIAGSIDNIGGSISSTGDTLTGAIPGVNGGGALATVQFETVKNGISSISLTNIILLDSSLNNVDFTVADGSVDVSGTTVPEPGTWWLLGLGLAMSLVRKIEMQVVSTQSKLARRMRIVPANVFFPTFWAGTCSHKKYLFITLGLIVNGANAQEPLQITTSTLPTATAGITYKVGFSAQGGTPPYHFFVLPNNSSIPGFLVFQVSPATNTVTEACPIQLGTFQFTLLVSDSAFPAAETTKDLNVSVIRNPVALMFSPPGPSLPSTVVGDFYQPMEFRAVAASSSACQDVLAPYTWSLSGSLPPGIQFFPSTSFSAVISGIPTQAGTYKFKLQATDSTGNSGSQSYTVVVGGGLRLLLSSQEKQDLSDFSFQNNALSLFFEEVATNPICVALFEIECPELMESLSLGTGVASTLADAILNADPPDSNFTTIAQPVYPPATVLAAPSGLPLPLTTAFNALTTNYNKQIGLLQAMFTSINRVQGAIVAQNAFWEVKQRQAATFYGIAIANLIAQQPNLRQALITAFEGVSVPDVQVSPQMISSLESEVAANGLPSKFVAGLSQLGLSQGLVASLQEKDSQATAYFKTTVNFPNYVANPAFAAADLNHAEALDQFASDRNGDLLVDCADLAIVKASFGKIDSQPGFDPRADVNMDGIVDIRDLAFVSQHLPAGTRCQ